MKSENYFKKRPFVSSILILLAFVLISVSWVFAMVVGGFYYWNKEKIYEYLYNVGISIDYLVAAIFFNVRGHTVSAIVYKREYWKWVWLVNWLFRDSDHCRSSFEKEYRGEK